MSTTDDATVHWGEIDGVSIDFPMVVRRMHQATLTFDVPIDAARDLLPGDAFEVVETQPGRAMFVMALVDYVENPWGDYNEVNLGLIAAPVGDPAAAGAVVYRMPVDQEFTMRAGNQVLGLPKTVEDLTVDHDDRSATFTLRVDGRVELAAVIPRAAAQGPPTETETITYSYLDGRPTVLPLTIEIGSGVIDPSEVQLELGDGALAQELRSLGLPRAPDMALWGEDLSGTFGAPRPLPPPAPAG